MESGPGRTCLALPSLAVFGGRDELGSGARIVQRASAEPRQTAIEQTVVGLIRRWSKTAVTKRYRLFVGLRHCSRSCSPFAVIQFCTNGPPRTRTVGGVGAIRRWQKTNCTLRPVGISPQFFGHGQNSRDRVDNSLWFVELDIVPRARNDFVYSTSRQLGNVVA